MRKQVVVCSFCSLLAACSDPTNPRVLERVSYWRSSLAHGIPPGTTVSGAQEWFRTRHIKVYLLQRQRWLYAKVESVPDESPVSFPCRAWNIIIRIPLDTSDHTVKNDVSTVGSCL